MKITVIIIGVVIVVGAAFFVFLPSPSPSLPPETVSIEEEPVSAPEPLPVGEFEPEPQPADELKPQTFPEPAVTQEPQASLCPSSREPEEFIVNIYSFTDWQPASLTVCAGDTITFINQDDALHWPGADPHPTHTSLPQFDALGGISKGQSYSHTFRKPGAYGHHEHLLDDPPTLGIITVLPKEQP